MEPKPIEPDKDSLVARLKDVVFAKVDRIKEAISYSIKKYNLDGSSSMQLAYSGAGADEAVYQSMELATGLGQENYKGFQCSCNQCCDSSCNQCRYD